MKLLGAYNTTGDQPAGSVSSSTFKQSFYSPLDGLNVIEILFETPPTDYDHLVTVSVFTVEGEQIRQSDTIVPTTIGNSFAQFEFEPISDSRGKDFYFTISSEILDASPTAVTQPAPMSVHLKYSEHDYYLRGELFIDNQPSGGDLVFRTFHQAETSHPTHLLNSFTGKISADPVFFGVWLLLLLIISLSAVFQIFRK